jgi:hypothetical protein
MRRKYIAAVFCAAFAALCALLFSMFVKSEPIKQGLARQEQINSAPDYVVYRMLLHHVHLFNEKAEKAEQAGKHESARAYRSAFKNKAQINDEQTRTLHEIAEQCEWAVEEVDARAKIIINARREHRKRTGEVLPPSEELQELQNERNAIILHHRDRLRQALGEQEWTRFQEFVRQQVIPNLTTTQ